MSENPGSSSRLACVYTTLIGGYEELNEQPVAATSRLPFICLTDDPELRSETWAIRLVEPLFGLDPVRSQRALKLCPHDYLPDFDCSIYLDNAVVLKTPPEALFDRYFGPSGFSLPEHSYRHSVLEEFLEVEALGYDDQGRLFEQLNHYAFEIPEVLEEKPYWTAVLLRDHRSPKVRRMLDIWHAHVQRYSRRDQLSVNLAFRRAGLTPEVLRVDNNESWFHSWPVGKRVRRAGVLRLASPFLSHPAARAKELARDNAAQADILARLEAELAQERLGRESFIARVAEMEMALAAERSNSESMKAQNQALRSSTSWRLTAPLRNIVTAVRSFGRSPIADRSNEKAVAAEQVEPRQEEDLPTSPENPAAAAFFRDGFVGPIDLFTKAQCELIVKHYRRGVPSPLNPEWPKDLAARDRLFYEVAKRPAVIALLRPLLGEDIVLWGASVVERASGQTHIWHTDIESSAPGCRFVTLWVGLENTCRDSALKLISRSHRFGRPIQQEVYERGLRRGDATDEMVTAWAREADGHSNFVQSDMSDGQGLLMDGGLWHASHNAARLPRAALLLQYAAAGTPVKIPNFNHVEWPFGFTSAEPPSVVVAGQSKNGNVVPPPFACLPGHGPVRSQTYSGSGFHESPEGWVPYHFFQGPTALLTEMESHASVLSPSCLAHPPHSHVQEELLIVLSGEAEILIGEGPDPNGARVERLREGSFVYYPAYQYHTIRNSSASPVTYVMYKWQAPPAEVSHPMQTGIFDIGGASPPSSSQPMSMPLLFEAPTGYLDKLHAHVTDMQVGAGYPAHIDEHEVAIVVFSGTLKTLGKTLGAGGTIFYAAGEPHGMDNVGDKPARYLVFEFHRASHN
jgi:quercetin dioxygenase-like cupin family protein